MLRQSIRRFGTTALRAAEGSTAYGVRVSQAQGYVNGLTEGMRSPHLAEKRELLIYPCCNSNWKYPPHPIEAHFRTNRLQCPW